MYIIRLKTCINIFRLSAKRKRKLIYFPNTAVETVVGENRLS